METAQIVSFAWKIAENLDNDSKSVSIKRTEEDRYVTNFECKTANTALSFSLTLRDITGSPEFHAGSRTFIPTEKKEEKQVAKTYSFQISNSGNGHQTIVTDLQKDSDAEFADVYNAFEKLYNSLLRASEKNLSSDVDAIING
ncbi:hypothetical protein [Hymenobacter terrenus]|uniref:hypothetical protein n=1 Tax=Hymenobacter terrenus TaxID=1629124 RepID=UPI0006194057|nr:hypothetical protein [Hymenobacter terrenus]